MDQENDKVEFFQPECDGPTFLGLAQCSEVAFQDLEVRLGFDLRRFLTEVGHKWSTVPTAEPREL